MINWNCAKEEVLVLAHSVDEKYGDCSFVVSEVTVRDALSSSKGTGLVIEFVHGRMSVHTFQRKVTC